MDQDDELIVWQDVLESVLAGRTAGLKCPYCKTGGITVSHSERKSLIQCQNAKCRHFIEGSFGDSQIGLLGSEDQEPIQAQVNVPGQGPGK